MSRLAVRGGPTSNEAVISEARRQNKPGFGLWASAAKEWGLAVNWHLARGNKLCLNYENIHFTDGAPGGNNRPTEAAILARFQAYF
jgi:hypothetical protein